MNNETRGTAVPFALALLAFAAVSMLMPVVSAAYESAFDRTPVGEVQVRDLPAGRWLVTRVEGRYPEQSNTLFRRLAGYIGANDVSMTVPVLGGVDAAEMRFFLGADAPADLQPSAYVAFEDRPAQRVVALGARGGYGEANLEETRSAVLAWLDGQAQWRRAGEPYAVFWSGPFTPWFMKRYEIHVPVEPR